MSVVDAVGVLAAVMVVCCLVAQVLGVVGARVAAGTHCVGAAVLTVCLAVEGRWGWAAVLGVLVVAWLMAWADARAGQRRKRRGVVG